MQHVFYPFLRHDIREATLVHGTAGPVTVERFLGDVAALAARLPDAPHVINLCTDRYRFTVGFAAALCRRQVTLLPSSDATAPLEQLARQYDGAYFLHDSGFVAAPDLANLRNTKNMFDLLRASRPNDRMPLYCLNQVGVPKRPEINASEFAKAIESQPIATLPFDPQMFGSAANNGQMIAEISANHRTTEMFLQIAQRLTGRGETKKPRGSFLSPLIEKLRAK